MCIAIPMKVVSVSDNFSAVCDSGEKTETVNKELTGLATPGEWLLVFQGASQRRMTEDEALKMRTALVALSDVMSGTATQSQLDDAFADITAHTGELPDFLKAQVKVNKQ